MSKAVFLDRDGVINNLIVHNDRYTAPWSLNEFKYIDNPKKSIDILKKLNYKIFIITNQPDVLDGNLKLSELKLINKKLKSEFDVDNIFCLMRRDSIYYKPNNNLVEIIIDNYSINRDKSYFVGDSWKDIFCGHASKLKTVYIGNEFNPPFNVDNIQPNFFAKNLNDACKYIKDRTK